MLTTAIEAAKEAGKILLSHYGNLKEIAKKENAGLATIADKEAEKKIIHIIHKKFPDHSILAEESGLHQTSSSVKWIIDPLDGTTNFAHHIPLFTVSIGIEQGGTIIGGVIFDPIHKELFTAEKSKGAFCNGKKIHVSKTPLMEDALFVTGYAYQKGQLIHKEVLLMEPFQQKSHGIRRSGSAAWDMCQVACGRFDGFWEKRLQPWDVAAGTLLIQEAGGKISHYDGGSATIYDQEIVVSNGILHNDMIQILTA